MHEMKAIVIIDPWFNIFVDEMKKAVENTVMAGMPPDLATEIIENVVKNSVGGAVRVIYSDPP